MHPKHNTQGLAPFALKGALLAATLSAQRNCTFNGNGVIYKWHSSSQRETFESMERQQLNAFHPFALLRMEIPQVLIMCAEEHMLI